MKKKTIFTALGAVIVISAAVWFFMVKEKAVSYSYETKKIERGTLESTITSTGTLNPVGSVEVGTQVSGTISKVYVDYNDTVKKDQIITELDRTFLSSALEEAKASLSRARALYEQAEAEYERCKPLHEKKFLSDQEFAKVKTDYLSQKAALEISQASVNKARINLGYATIRSPISGMVISRNVEVGQTVSASLSAPVLFVIAENLSNMEILASVDESDIGNIKSGQDVRFSVQAHSEKTFTGKVSQIRLQPEVIQNVVTYTVVINAQNPEGLLLPGMTANLEFIEKRLENVLLVPSAALRFTPPEKILAQMRKNNQEKPGEKSAAEAGRPRMGGQGGQGEPGPRKANRAMIWLMLENGSIEPAFIQTGASDGSRTEIVSTRNEKATEGALVITGLKTETQQNSRKPVSILPQPNMRRR